MEASGLSSGMLSNMGSGMLGLEMSLSHPLQHLPHQSPQNPRQFQQQHPHHSATGYENHPQTQQSAKQGNAFASKAKTQQLTFSDDDEPGVTADDVAGDGKRKISPWQRMKWTDSMVRLLIMVVFYVGDEAGSEVNDPSGKKKISGGVLQKKGKWKSVSRAMMERGFYVSPQQCEDKFNDLNKRYKRVNDILGKGTSCRVVENQKLLDAMDNLSPKMKEEVKKLLNSKHLFFREMCAYHNSCGGGVSGGGAHQMAEIAAAEPSQVQIQASQQRCFHSPENLPIAANSGRAETEVSKMAKGGSGEDEDNNDDNDEEDDDDEEVGERGRHEDEDEDEDEMDERYSRKRQREEMLLTPMSPRFQQFSAELSSVIEDESKSLMEKRQWVKTRLRQLEEQRMGFHCQAFELEKQRLKWLKFSSNKEREMDREKLVNERMKLENERMALHLRQRELELLDHYHHHHHNHHQQQQSSTRRTDPSSIA